MKYLRFNTAGQALSMGPFLDVTDAKTKETGLTIANTDIRIAKAGGAQAAKNSGGATHDAGGVYTTTLDATDTDTLGSFTLRIDDPAALDVKIVAEVIPQKVYDSMFAGTDTLEVDVIQMLGAVGTSLPATQASVDTVDTNVDTIAVDTGTTIPASLSLLSTQASVDVIDANVDTIGVDTGTTIPAALSLLSTQASVDVIDATVDQIAIDTGTTTPASLALLSTQASVDVIDGIVDTIATDTGTTIPASIAALNDISTGDVDTSIANAALATASALATVDVNVDSVLADTSTSIPGQIAGLNDFNPSTDTVSVGQINGSATAAINLAEGAESSLPGLATATSLSTTQMSTNLSVTADITGRAVIWKSGALNGLARTIVAYDGGSKTMTFDTISVAPTSGDEFIVV